MAKQNIGVFRFGDEVHGYVYGVCTVEETELESGDYMVRYGDPIAIGFPREVTAMIFAERFADQHDYHFAGVCPDSGKVTAEQLGYDIPAPASDPSTVKPNQA